MANATDGKLCEPTGDVAPVRLEGLSTFGILIPAEPGTDKGSRAPERVPGPGANAATACIRC